MAVLAAAATAGALSSPAAAEGETPPGQVPGRVEFPTHCLAPQEAGLPPADGPTTARITVDNPAARVGDTVTVTFSVISTPAVNPLPADLPADVLTPTGRVVLGGALSGEVTVVGAKRNAPVEAGGALPAVTMTGTFTVTAPGEITLAPGGYTLHTSNLLDLDTTCAADAPPVRDPAQEPEPEPDADPAPSTDPAQTPGPAPDTTRTPATPAPVPAPARASPTPSPSPTGPTGPAPSASTPPTPTTPPATAASPRAAPTNRGRPPVPGRG
ncbi:hypothetical protein J7E97_06515 [Streptomyces sp. ISL-66]|uniref:hypothetical protein n=1 Tax=Streptomyces sp. ISL-66 TaxID=2819186 RepID=UPI001BE548C4|nr:hypothetical protein [Streptomyces sp. ISL-66]MBT2467530.1 hypothetical protein [Streptomyces sp. ISL-66]